MLLLSRPSHAHLLASTGQSAAIFESGTLSDFVQRAAGTFVGALSESGTLVSAQSSAAHLVSSLSESGALAVTTSEASPPSGLILWWPFNDTVTTDASTSGNTGTLSGSPLPTLVTGQSGNALQFASGGYVAFANITNFGMSGGTSEFTIAMWINSTALDACLMSLRGSSGTPLIDFVIGYNGVTNANTGQISCIVRDDAGNLAQVSASSAVNDGTWHHVAVTRSSAGTLTLYQDATSVGSVSDGMTTSLTPTLADCSVGQEVISGTPGFVGTMENVRIYTRALSSGELAVV